MVALSALLLAGSVLSGISAASSDVTFAKRQNTASEVIAQGEGIGSDGFFYTVWDDGNMEHTFTNQPGGKFDLKWSGNGDVVAGKGWKMGTNRAISYSGTYKTDNMSFLMVYGWFKNPLVEYYIMENWDEESDPSMDSDMQKITTLTSDGAEYDVFKKRQVDWPSIEGKSTTFDQYRSVRRGARTAGTVTTDNHFKAWQAAGLTLNEEHYQVVAVEAMKTNAKGNASITVWEGNAAPAPAPSSSAAPEPAPAPPSSSQPVESPAPPAPPAPVEPQPTTSVIPPPPAPPAPTQIEQAPTSIPAPAPTQPTPITSTASRTNPYRGFWTRRRKGRKSRTTVAPSGPPAPAPTVAPEANEAVTTTVVWVTVTATA